MASFAVQINVRRSLAPLTMIVGGLILVNDLDH